MINLIDRYVHQVGRYLPPSERAEVESELRSQIQDQLDDRYGATPSQANIESVLSTLGHPRLIAASYSTEQSLVGPDVYPYLMVALKFIWLVVPAVAIFMNIFGALVSSEQVEVLDLLIDTFANIAQLTLMFSALVIFIFAFMERSSIDFSEKESETSFQPADLPEVDDPRSVDRFESIFGIVLGTFFLLIMLYFLRVGGLTLRFDLNNPGEIIPIPTFWTVALIINANIIMILHIYVLRHNSWNAWLWQLETALELFGIICMFFVLIDPIFERTAEALPSSANLSFINSLPEAITTLWAISTAISRTTTLVKLWGYKNDNTPSLSTKTNG